ncbi:hypothetical protein [Caldithrix abyssi]
MLQIINKYLILLIGGILLTCTNPFTTREGQVEAPENFSPGQNGTYDPAVNPELVFVNLKKALQDKNIAEYMKCFIPQTLEGQPHSFLFIPEQHFVNEFARQPWTLNDEQNYFTQLVQSQLSGYPKLDLILAEGNEIPLNPITPTSVNDSLESGSVKYNLRISFSPDSSKTYSGLLQFRLFKSRTPPEVWYIYFWQDNALNQNYDGTWTALKLYYRKKAL